MSTEDQSAGGPQSAATEGEWLGNILAAHNAVISLVVVELVGDAVARYLRRGRVGQRLRGLDSDGRAVWLGVALVPLVLWVVDGILTAVGHGAHGPPLAWIGVYTLTLWWLLATGLWVKRRLTQIAPRLDELLVTDQDRQTLERWLERNLQIKWQLALCLLGAIVGAIVTAISDESYLSGVNKPGLAWYVVSGVTGFFVIDAVSWAVRLPWVVLKLRGLGRLRVLLHSPVSTPGIRELSDFLVWVGANVSGGVTLFAIPLWWPVLLESPHPTKTFEILTVFPFALSLLIAGWVTVGSQLLVSSLVEAAKNRILDEIAATLPGSNPLELVNDDVKRKTDLYDAIAATSSRTVDARFVLKQAAALLAVTGPLLGSLVKGILS